MRRKSMVFILCFLFSAVIFAQQRVNGVVTDIGNVPIPGLTILEKGTGNGVVTDIDGHYTISVSGGNSILVFSFIGMKTQEIEVGNRGEISVVMTEEQTDLDELVVIGYGLQRKALVTGANVNVTGDQIAELRTTTAMEALQGITPGVQVIRNHGAPGAGTKVTIRGMGTIGAASPLYIVDGVSTSNIDYLNASDIESIDVLKDAASAAIYGSRAANGVILVTTKKGVAGAKPTVSYDGYFGVQNVYKKPAVLNAQEYMYLFDEARINEGAAPYDWKNMIVNGNVYLNNNFSKDIGVGYGNYVWDKLQSGWTGTDWVDEMSMSNAPMQSHSLNIAGGSQDMKYALGVSYLEQSGIIGGDITDAGFKRLTARMNTEMVLFKNNNRNLITIGENLTFTNTQNRTVATGDIYYNDLHSAIVANPLLPLHYDKHELLSTTYGYAPTLEGVHRNLHNPVAQMYFRHNFNWGKSNSIIGNVYALVEPIKNLKYRSSFGVNSWFGHSRNYNPVYGLADSSKRTSDGVTQSKWQGANYTWTNTLTYDLKKGNHDFSFLIGSEMLKNVLNSNMSAFKAKTAFGHPDNAYLDNVQVVESVGDIWATGRDWAAQGGGLMSYMSRVSYNFLEKYMVDVTFRADGSSNFAKNNRWGYFPSISAGWNFSDEEFMSDLDWLSFGKLRASWGQNGNQDIANFIYLSNIEYLSKGYYFGPDKLVSSSTAIPANIPNSDIKWETSEQLNFGIDARLLNSRLGINFDWYKKTTKDWLVVAPVLGTSGAGAPYINGGDVENTGYEIMLSWNDKVSDFNYGITLSGAQNRNRVTRLDNAEGVITGSVNVIAQNTSYVSRVAVGEPIGYFYGYKTDGIFQNQAEANAYVTADGKPIEIGSEEGVPRQPGDVRFIDQNGDGIIDDKDKVKIGSPHPDFELGVQLNAEYKGFYINSTLVGKFGMQVMQSYRDFAGLPMENYPASAMNRWHGEGTSNRLPRISSVTNANSSYVSDIYVHNADFLRVSNLTLGYKFDKLLKSVQWLQSASLYVSVNNLYTFTKYDGMDPEIGYAPDSWASGVDLGLYPLPRTVVLGVNLTF